MRTSRNGLHQHQHLVGQGQRKWNFEPVRDISSLLDKVYEFIGLKMQISLFYPHFSINEWLHLNHSPTAMLVVYLIISHLLPYIYIYIYIHTISHEYLPHCWCYNPFSWPIFFDQECRFKPHITLLARPPAMGKPSSPLNV